MTELIERHLMRLRARHKLTAEDEQAIRDAVGGYRDLPAGETFLRAGERLDASTLLLDGIMGRYKDLRDGQRQISELHVAGDFADLHSFTLKKLDHNVMALTPCRIATMPHRNLTRITEERPHLTRLYWFSTNLDASIHREWELSLGRRTAISRIANLFCELHARLGLVGLSDATGFALPLTQIDLSECLGLTPVHVNRVLKELRERGCTTFRNGRVTIQDMAALRRIAEFDPSYLYLQGSEI